MTTLYSHSSKATATLTAGKLTFTKGSVLLVVNDAQICDSTSWQVVVASHLDVFDAAVDRLLLENLYVTLNEFPGEPKLIASCLSLACKLRVDSNGNGSFGSATKKGWDSGLAAIKRLVGSTTMSITYNDITMAINARCITVLGSRISEFVGSYSEFLNTLVPRKGHPDEYSMSNLVSYVR